MKKRPVKKPRAAPVEKPKTGAFITAVNGVPVSVMLKGKQEVK